MTDSILFQTFQQLYMHGRKDIHLYGMLLAQTHLQFPKDRYQFLVKNHHFIPIVVETSKALGQEAIAFLKELGK